MFLSSDHLDMVPAVIESKLTSKTILTNKESIHGISCHWNNIEILNSRQNIVNADSCMCSNPRNPKSLHFKVNFCFILASLPLQSNSIYFPNFHFSQQVSVYQSVCSSSILIALSLCVFGWKMKFITLRKHQSCSK